MKLQLVTGKPFTCTCIKCGKKGLAGDKTKDNLNRIITQVFYADLDGQPFKDYYCEDCRNKIFKTAKVIFSNGDSITTSINPNCSDNEIKQYYAIGKSFNLGDGENDLMAKVVSVEILK